MQDVVIYTAQARRLLTSHMSILPARIWLLIRLNTQTIDKLGGKNVVSLHFYR
jgi:hypothetical protein